MLFPLYSDLGNSYLCALTFSLRVHPLKSCVALSCNWLRDIIEKSVSVVRKAVTLFRFRLATWMVEKERQARWWTFEGNACFSLSLAECREGDQTLSGRSLEVLEWLRNREWGCACCAGAVTPPLHAHDLLKTLVQHHVFARCHICVGNHPARCTGTCHYSCEKAVTTVRSRSPLPQFSSSISCRVTCTSACCLRGR